MPFSPHCYNLAAMPKLVPSSLVPLADVTRGGFVESVNLGAIAVAQSDGNLIASAGDPL